MYISPPPPPPPPGVAHGAFNNDIEGLLGMRELFGFLPLNNTESSPVRKCDDPWFVLVYFNL